MSTKILIIDDEANIRRMVGSLLKSEGFEVAEAPNGNAGLLAIPEVHPDLILLDLMMPPGPDGLATLERIRATDTDIPVIMMSGKAQLSDAVRESGHRGETRPGVQGHGDVVALRARRLHPALQSQPGEKIAQEQRRAHEP